MTKRGSYLGGSTIIRPGSDWFSKPKRKLWVSARSKEPEASGLSKAPLEGYDFVARAEAFRRELEDFKNRPPTLPCSISKKAKRKEKRRLKKLGTEPPPTGGR